MLNIIKDKFEMRNFRRKWREKNQHNTTIAINRFDLESVEVGKETYGAINVLNFSSGEKLVIGHYCSIAPNVLFILNADHSLNTISTFPFKVKCMGQNYEAVSKGDIVVGSDVWIGYGATILSGINIGQGAVVAAGSIVTKDVPPYAIVGGNPARVIKYRFPKEIIDELMKIDYSQLDRKLVEEHIEELYQELTQKEQLEWLPKK